MFLESAQPSNQDKRRLKLDVGAAGRMVRHALSIHSLRLPSPYNINPDAEAVMQAKTATIELALKIFHTQGRLRYLRKKSSHHEPGEVFSDGTDIYERLKNEIYENEVLLRNYVKNFFELPPVMPLDLTWENFSQVLARFQALDFKDAQAEDSGSDSVAGLWAEPNELTTLQDQVHEVRKRVEVLVYKKAVIKSIKSLTFENPTLRLNSSTDAENTRLRAKLALQRAIDEEKRISESKAKAQSCIILDPESTLSNSPSRISSLLQFSPESIRILSPLSQLSPLTTISSVGPSDATLSAAELDSQARQLLDLVVQEHNDEVELEGQLEMLQAHFMRKLQNQTENLIKDKLMEIPSFRRLKAREVLRVLPKL
ncbi:hypothetical protein GYMLUDRAFT_245180 [Collybiopsis luxurians FD-317 M1]|uniref:Uncharacterized protein n=1 Tax=Collybiopsis luxurians FD-317 M1 TaxID=944289 RepID=A0A0D0BVG9_9AGAR|nr:hypothetical protein GYMLUDRAFT_245180 [Collybiopsis luxurians FD-317 M1]